jgi:putative tryptophan/tyrosine transport system substrate-binding protein
MNRREFVAILGGAAAAWPLAARAQQDVHVARVGVLAPSLDSIPPLQSSYYPSFLAELRKLGFEQGRSLLVEYRSIGQDIRQAAVSVNELIAWKADVLFVFGPEFPLRAAASAAPIPIVVGAMNYDPIAKGFVQSLARPGGNITGVISRWPAITAKQVELLQEAFPDRKRLGMLWDAASADQFAAAESQAKAMQLELRGFKFENPPYDFAAAFRALAQEDVQAIIVGPSPLFPRHSAKIAALAMEHRLPSMFIVKFYIEDGGLMSYGVDVPGLMRRAASLVAKILRGAKVADLPLEQVDRFEFVVNLKTAKAIGVTLPTSTLLRADEVIE